MKSKTHRPLGLEKLEDRWVPSTVRFDGSNLYVSNPLVTAGASSLSVIQTSATAFQVKDGAANNGFYAVTGNVTIQGNNAKDTVTVNVLAGSGLVGNLSVNGGNGPNKVTVDSTAATGFIAGNSRITLGNGTNTVSFGSTVGLNEKGSLYASSRGTGPSTATVLGGGAAGSVLGSTTISGFPTLTLGGANKDVFAGGVYINNVGNSQTSVITLAATSSDLGNFTVQGGQGPTAVTLNGNVLGSVSMNVGNFTNSLTLGTGVSIGSLQYTGGNGSNSLAVTAATATVLGNVYLNWGNGANSFGLTKGLVVDGSMLVTNGNGSFNSGTFDGNVFGNLYINNGNGNNTFTLDVTGGANVGGNWYYTGGNGGNSVTINNTTANSTALNIRFGTGSANLLTLNAGAPGTGNLSGTVTWAVPTAFVAGTNGFVDNGYVWQNNITLTNIPS